MVFSTSFVCSAQTHSWPLTNYWEGRIKGVANLRENLAVDKYPPAIIEKFLNRFQQVPDNQQFLDELKNYIVSDLCACSAKNDFCVKRISEKFIISARKQNYLDDPAFTTLFNDLKNKNKKKYVKLISLSVYDQSLKVLRNKYQENAGHLPGLENVFDYKWKEFFIKVNGVYLSPRAKLYNQYNTFQIKQLAKLMDETMKTMNAEKISINVDYDGDGITERKYDLPIPEKYRMALRLLNLEKQRLVQEGMLPATPQNLDLLTAAFESGMISGELLNELVNMKELKVKNFDRYKVYKQMLVRIGKAGVTAIPVVGPILIIPIVIIESFIDLRKNNHVSDASHIF